MFVGFEDGQTATIGSLFEFTTASGEYVYLHEMECIDLQYLPLHRQFVITFECVWSALMSACMVTLTFEDAEIHQWESEFEPGDPTVLDPRVRGQVMSFNCIEDSVDGFSFHLGLSDTVVGFRASMVTCEVRPWAPN